mgnify:CR=1 FL=1|jgi:hypothetical protein
MGQMTYGVLLGCKMPEGVTLYDDEYDTPMEKRGLINRWQDACADNIAALKEKLEARGARGMFWRAKGCYVPDLEYDSGLLGFWCAVGASGKEGVPFLEEAFALSAKAFREHAVYGKAYRKARRRWRRFARWAATQGVTLPKARLYLTMTEVA